MREIKFRFRLKSKENGEEITVCAKLYDELSGIMHHPIELDRWDVLSIDEYTGLKDQNGKEVYEGDVLKCTDDADNFITNGVVEWLHDFWNISAIENSLYQFTRYGYIEVIGNIHSNPKLVKGNV